MMKTYEIIIRGNEKDIIYYDENGNEETRELYEQEGFQAEIKEGYILKSN